MKALAVASGVTFGLGVCTLFGAFVDGSFDDWPGWLQGLLFGVLILMMGGAVFVPMLVWEHSEK